MKYHKHTETVYSPNQEDGTLSKRTELELEGMKVQTIYKHEFIKSPEYPEVRKAGEPYTIEFTPECRLHDGYIETAYRFANGYGVLLSFSGYRWYCSQIVFDTHSSMFNHVAVASYCDENGELELREKMVSAPLQDHSDFISRDVNNEKDFAHFVSLEIDLGQESWKVLFDFIEDTFYLPTAHLCNWVDGREKYCYIKPKTSDEVGVGSLYWNSLSSTMQQAIEHVVKNHTDNSSLVSDLNSTLSSIEDDIKTIEDDIESVKNDIFTEDSISDIAYQVMDDYDLTCKFDDYTYNADFVTRSDIGSEVEESLNCNFDDFVTNSTAVDDKVQEAFDEYDTESLVDADLIADKVEQRMEHRIKERLENLMKDFITSGSFEDMFVTKENLMSDLSNSLHRLMVIRDATKTKFVADVPTPEVEVQS